MLAELGLASVTLAFACAVFAAVAALIGVRRHSEALVASARNAALLVFPLTLTAALALLVGLLSQQYQITYVWQVTNPNTPMFYRFTALWGSQAGSLLFWNLLMSGFAFVALLVNWHGNRRLMPYVIVYTMAVSAFFLGLTLFLENPFARYWITPDGSVVTAVFIPAGAEAPSPARLAATARGLNPLLRHFGMIIHPPMLYLGFVSFVIPFAFAMAALASSDLSTNWIKATRRWTLIAWLFLSLGLLLGGRWAYDVLGWGGYWGWDPVENAAFIPWLTGTAFLHSVMIQEKRGMLKKWNLGLVTGSFLLSIFGTFITRSGVIASVHTFTQSPVGWYFLIFLVIAGVAAFSLLAWRWPKLAADSQLESMVSREAAFLFNNLIFIVIAFSVLWGTLFPILSEWVRGTKVTVGPPFFNQVNVPLGLMLLFLTGVGPLIAWRRASTANLQRQFLVPAGTFVVVFAALLLLGMRELSAAIAFALGGFVAATIFQEFVRGTGARHRLHAESYPLAFLRLVGRNRRRYGGYVVHLGMVMLFVGFAGEAFRTDTEATLRPGQSVEIASPFGHTYRLEHQGVSQYPQLNRYVSAASLSVYRNGEYLGVMTSEKRQHLNALGQRTFEPSTEVAIRSDIREDLYVVYAGSVEGTEEAVYRMTINPLVWWVWYGGIVLVIGGLVTMWPGGAVATARARAEPAGYVAEVTA